LLRRELRSRQQRALREAVERVDRLRSEVEAARSTLLREQGLFAALDALVRSRRRDAEQHEARMTQTEIDDDWLQRPRVSLSGEGR
jgi:signal transduction histidine kinase